MEQRCTEYTIRNNQALLFVKAVARTPTVCECSILLLPATLLLPIVPSRPRSLFLASCRVLGILCTLPLPAM